MKVGMKGELLAVQMGIWTAARKVVVMVRM